MKIKDILECIALFLLIVIMAMLQKSETAEIKQRYEIVQEEKQYLLEENIKLEDKLQELLKEQDNNSNNLDTKEVDHESRGQYKNIRNNIKL